MKLLIGLLVAVTCWYSAAQPTGTLTSPNLVYSTVNPYPGTESPGTWSGFAVTTSTGGGVSGGNTAGYNVSTGTFMFGYTQSTIAYNYALNTALKNSGMSWLGYNYAWEYYNQDYSRGTLTANVTFNSTTGTVLHNKNWTLDKTTQGWTAVSGTEMFTNPLATANINSFNLNFSGKDDRFWAGYYGPMVRNPSISVLYTFDQCTTNPLSSPDCPGYQQALLDQQCTANPLYSTACPGYAAAYQTQQCTVNPLYSPECPGYQVAYFNQQCTANPLYATTCPGYEQAYLNAQCIKDSLYSRLCTGYATAYAIKYLTPVDSTTSSAINSSLSTTAAVKASDPVSVNTTGTVTTTPSATGNATVDAVITTPSTTSTTSVTSVTSVTAPPPPPVGGVTATSNATAQASAPPPPPPPAVQAERAAENKKTEGAVASVERKSGGNAEAAKKEATERAKELANNMSKAATLEAQAASQGLVVGLMAYVPGFSAYQNAIVPDILGAQVARQYHKPTVDNRSAQRQLSGANDRLHREMVEQQYRQGQ